MSTLQAGDANRRIPAIGPAPESMPETILRFGMSCIKKGILPDAGKGEVLREGTFALAVTQNGDLREIADIRMKKQVPDKNSNSNSSRKKEQKQKEEPLDAGQPDETKMKTVYIKLPIVVPYSNKHSNTISPHLGADNAAYLCGVISEDKDDGKAVIADGQSVERFDSCKELHLDVLGGVDSPLAQGICRFFEKWDPETADKHPAILALTQEQLTAFLGATYITFKSAETGMMAMEDPEIRKAFSDRFIWDLEHEEGTYFGECAVTGAKNVPIADLHTSFTGVRNANSSGAPMITEGSSPHSTSNYADLKRGQNYPIEKKTSIIIHETIRYLMKDRRHYRILPNDSYLLYWMDPDGIEDNDAFDASAAIAMVLYGRQKYIYNTPADEELAHTVKCMLAASPNTEDFEMLVKHRNKKFFTLTIKGNGARIVPMNFESGTFGNIMESVRQHIQDTSLIYSGPGTKGERRDFNLWELCRSLESKKTVMGKTEYKTSLPPDFMNTMLNAILGGAPYPQSIGSVLMGRIARDKWLSPARIAMMRGFVLRNGQDKKAREAASLNYLNEGTECQAYIRGRILSEVHSIQALAVNGPKRTVKSKYFVGMMRQPEMLLASLLTDAGMYLESMKNKPTKRALAFYHENKLAALVDRLSYPIPPNVQRKWEEQMAFCLGFAMAEQYQYFPKHVREALNGDESASKAYHPAGLNEASDDPAYIAGRIFYRAEWIQRMSNPGVKGGLKSTYFRIASEQWGMISPRILANVEHHTNRIMRTPGKAAIAKWNLNVIQEMESRLPTTEGGTLIKWAATPGSRAAFVLGYYHERAYLWRSKEFKEMDAILKAEAEELADETDEELTDEEALAFAPSQDDDDADSACEADTEE